MVARAGQRRGRPSANSVVSVADLLARDAPWSDPPCAVAVAKRPTGTTRSGPALNGSPSVRRPADRPASVRAGAPRPATRTAPARAGDTRMRQFAAAAWGPRWRLVTIAAAVLVTGLMANGVMLVALHGPAHSTTAEPDEGGYPTGTEDPNQASRSYDDGGNPIDSALTPMFAAPGAGNLAAANTSGVGLPLTLTSLGTSVLTSPPTATTVTRSAPAVSAPVRAVSPTRTGTGTSTGSVATAGRSSSSGGVVDTVRDTASDLGRTVDKTASGLGKTAKKTADGLSDTVGDVADDLLGGGSSKSRSSGGKSSSSSHSSNSSKSSSNGGLVGGLLGK